MINGDERLDPDARYHYSTWGNGPNVGRLVADSLELCDMGPGCTDRHVKVTMDHDE